MLARGAVPMIDLAYQGFGDGLEADVEGLRHMAAAVPEMLLAASCSKNFGVYRDRVGAAFVLSETPQAAEVTRSNLASLNRLNYSFPPDHGAKVVSLVLADPELRADWMAELEAMRTGMLELRQGLADALQAGDELRPLRLRRRPPRHVLAARAGAGAGGGAAPRTTASTWSATAG